MTLQAQLDAIRTAFVEQADEATVRVMHQATADLERSGLGDRAKGEGDLAPDFVLPSSGLGVFDLADARARGPVVLTFFRGHW